MTQRPLTRVVNAHRQREGGGFIVRRPLPSTGLDLLDPFLLVDEMGPIEYGPGEAIGAPDHPHRGFETVSYILDGELEHADSAGHRGALGPGDVQWMTAGGGIVHAEMPSTRMQRDGGRMHGFQIWVNLPARLKMTTPRYQDVSAAQIPSATTPDGTATVKIIAGSALGVTAVIDTHTPIVYQDWQLRPGADVTVDIPADQNAMAYVFEGVAVIGDGDDTSTLRDGQLAVFGAGDRVRLRGGDAPGRLLVLAGTPHREPIARYGPFVMNSRAELETAFRDYQSGKLGEITRTATH